MRDCHNHAGKVSDVYQSFLIHLSGRQGPTMCEHFHRVLDPFPILLSSTIFVIDMNTVNRRTTTNQKIIKKLSLSSFLTINFCFLNLIRAYALIYKFVQV